MAHFSLCHGQTAIKGLRVPRPVVPDGSSIEKILHSYPSLKAEDVQAAIDV